MAKPKVAICWLGGCGGCDEAVVDINEVLLSVAGAVDLVLWPVALDFKYDSIKALKDSEIALSIVNGNVRNSEQEEIAKLLREKSQLVLAFGACACFGGTPGLANLTTKEDVFDWVYRDSPTVINPNKNYPQTSTRVDGKELTLPDFYDYVNALNDVIYVDYYLPGCPPPPYLVMYALSAVLENKLPPKGSTLAPQRALCDSCKRNKSKPERIAIREIRRIHEVEAVSDTCFLAQGIICLGPALVEKLLHAPPAPVEGILVEDKESFTVTMVEMGNLLHDFLPAPPPPDRLPESGLRTVRAPISTATAGRQTERSFPHSMPVVGLFLHINKMVGWEREGV